MKWIVLTALMFAGVGCGSSATVQKFNVPFNQAETTLRTLYPPAFGQTEVDQLPAGAAKFEGKYVEIRRDELSGNQQETIQVIETARIWKIQEPPLHKTEIVLKAVTGGCQVEVQTSKTTKALLFPPRDEAYEQNQMNQIAEALTKK